VFILVLPPQTYPNRFGQFLIKMPLDTLLSPWQLGDLKLKNRVVMSPMTRSRSPNQIPNQHVLTYYVQRAGAGLIVAEACNVSQEAIGWLDTPGLWTDEQINAWKPITKAVHDAGGVIFLQLWHMGRLTHPSYNDGNPPVSSSAVPHKGVAHPKTGGHVPCLTPRPLETDEIPRVVEDYRRASENARKAGFDGVELHGANGYLVDQFLQSCVNKRTDKYGGSIENQFRFMSEVVDAIISPWDSPKRVGVRLGPNTKFNGMGSPEFRELFLYASEQLSKKHIGYLHFIDGGDFHGQGLVKVPLTLEDCRKVVPSDVAIIGAAGYTPEMADQELKKGFCDAIGFARLFLANPDLVARIKNNWPLAPLPRPDAWYTPDLPDRVKYNSGWGYIDFPDYEEEQRQKKAGITPTTALGPANSMPSTNKPSTSTTTTTDNNKTATNNDNTNKPSTTTLTNNNNNTTAPKLQFNTSAPNQVQPTRPPTTAANNVNGSRPIGFMGPPRPAGFMGRPTGFMSGIRLLGTPIHKPAQATPVGAVLGDTSATGNATSAATTTTTTTTA